MPSELLTPGKRLLSMNTALLLIAVGRFAFWLGLGQVVFK
ncbi:hypothetical protein P355_1054 [Burkholderia cenocepacia KC-01]|nr:hypothetical protein P355_1054 [Burkholderia cenocepacia KC-01]